MDNFKSKLKAKTFGAKLQSRP